uniref:Eclosion hormone n=1 Tax=Tetranychus urticae TaxID=32264 RepID=T1KBM9_TETUR
MNCLLIGISIVFAYLVAVGCDPELINSPSPNDKLHLCLHNCALCVRVWEHGLYNGEKCALKCLKFKENPRIIDPDCESLKLFNQKAFRIKKASDESD